MDTNNIFLDKNTNSLYTENPMEKNLRILTEEDLENSPTPEKSFLACGDVVGSIAEGDSTLSLSHVRLDPGWKLSKNKYSFSGSPDHVKVYLTVPFGTTNGKDTPKSIISSLKVLRNSKGVGNSTILADRGDSKALMGTHSLSFIDAFPGLNPVYEIASKRESSKGGGDLLIDGGTVSFVAVKK